jgi:hypothetical protein
MNGEVFIPITLFISAALMVVAVAFYRTRENLAMIERGLNPRANVAKPSPYRYYKWGLLLIGVGTGLVLAYILDRTVFHDHDSEPIYFALISIGAGLGLVFAHKAEKAYIESQPVTKSED